MRREEIWKHIHAERIALVETLTTLDDHQWATPSWCAGWSVRETAGHVLAAAEQTPANFYRDLAAVGFKFHAFTTKDARRLGALEPSELIQRLRARTTTTNHPPAPVMAMLGEIVVHGDDIRRPLGIRHQSEESALVAVADSWKNSNLLIGAKRRIHGLALHATDTDWSHGAGPAVTGPLQSLVLAMVGRRGSHVDLSGDGLELLTSRQ
jgi:uncharacterized protein (TIGR03083 family)